MFANTNPLGFLTTSRAQNVDQIIGKTEELVTELDLTLADLTPAQEALRAAKALYAARDYSEAAAEARRAGSLAVALNDRFNGYLAAWTVLQDCMEELGELGLPTGDFEAAVDAAEKEMARQVEEDGALVPNYLGAKEILERAAEDVRTLLVRARQASREIFLATLAVEALSDPTSDRTSSWLAVRLEELLEQATGELAQGHVPEARKLAIEARHRAEAAHAGDLRAKELMEEAANVLEHIHAEGPLADRLGECIASTREALAKGFLDATTEKVVVARLSSELLTFAEHYPRTRRVLEHAETVHASLRSEGFRSEPAEERFRDARRALREGRWEDVRANVSQASLEFLRWRKQRAALAKAITDIHQRVTLLEDFRLPLLPDVREILGRADEEFRTGRFSGATEDILFATALMTQATRTGS
ncbi:MAG TPA: hypothetical protein VEY12_11220 [Thermoplasmata archaeon]|nr:hypothetical protein [Thermoplasmata archaeon]